jgi:large subunit ribosomal protein L19
VRVHQKIVEGRNERIQVFQGVVIAMRGGKTPGQPTRCAAPAPTASASSAPSRFTARRSRKVEVLRKAKVRRAQLYYLRERQGKSARLREKRFLKV